MKKRILLVSPFPPELGGVSVSSQRLYDHLLIDGYDVDRFNIRYKKEILNNPLFLFVRFSFIPLYIVSKKKYDIIHFHVPGVLRKLYVSFFVNLYKNAKIVFTLHGDVTNLISSKLCLWSLSKADRIICVQEGDSRRLPNYLENKSIDIPAFILPTCISEEGLSDEVLAFAKRQDSSLLLFYGAVRLWDNYYDLYGIRDAFQLYKQLKNNKKTVRLLAFISYNSHDSKEINFLNDIKSESLSDYDVLIVENNKTSILSLYKYAAVYLRLTKTDGDSLAVREALALGCPVIASEYSERPEQCITYTDKDDLYSKACSVLESNYQIDKNACNNFYNKILSVYNSL